MHVQLIYFSVQFFCCQLVIHECNLNSEGIRIKPSSRMCFLVAITIKTSLWVRGTGVPADMWDSEGKSLLFCCCVSPCRGTYTSAFSLLNMIRGVNQRPSSSQVTSGCVEPPLVAWSNPWCCAFLLDIFLDQSLFFRMNIFSFTHYDNVKHTWDVTGSKKNDHSGPESNIRAIWGGFNNGFAYIFGLWTVFCLQTNLKAIKINWKCPI